MKRNRQNGEWNQRKEKKKFQITSIYQFRFYVVFFSFLNVLFHVELFFSLFKPNVEYRKRKKKETGSVCKRVMCERGAVYIRVNIKKDSFFSLLGLLSYLLIFPILLLIIEFEKEKQIYLTSFVRLHSNDRLRFNRFFFLIENHIVQIGKF